MKLTYATTNPYKLAGANHALAGYDLELVPLDKNLPDVPEIQSDDQAEVAIDKARKYYELLQQPLVVMDSGLFVELLGGFPGVYTKYVIDTIGAAAVAKLAADSGATDVYTQRTVVYFDGQTSQIFTSKIHGKLTDAPRGDNSSGYDLYFEVAQTGKTAAEMPDSEKAELAAPVWRELAEWLAKTKE